MELTREQVREMDRRAIEEFGIPGIILMENAGRAAALEAWSFLGGDRTALAVIVCGKGNNGGDGCVVARHLHNRGLDPRVFVLGPFAEIVGDAALNLGIVRRMGIAVTEVPPAPEVPDESGLPALAQALAEADVVIDAILGTGLAGEVRGLARKAIDAINAAGRPVIAIDIPSGLDANSGAVLGACVKADVTVTFVAPKTGFTRGRGPEMTGRLITAEIGIPRQVLAYAGARA